MSISLADLVAQTLKEVEPKTKSTEISTICPACKNNQRVVSPRGVRGPYCKDCAKRKMKEYRGKSEVRG